MDEANARQLLKYRVLISAFEQGRLTGTEFETLYLSLYKNDPTLWAADVYDVLQSIFRTVDDYVPSVPADIVHDSELAFRRAVVVEFGQLDEPFLG